MKKKLLSLLAMSPIVGLFIIIIPHMVGFLFELDANLDLNNLGQWVAGVVIIAALFLIVVVLALMMALFSWGLNNLKKQ